MVRHGPTPRRWESTGKAKAGDISTGYVGATGISQRPTLRERVESRVVGALSFTYGEQRTETWKLG